MSSSLKPEDIIDVRIRIVPRSTSEAEKLIGFCQILILGLIIKDIKIISQNGGRGPMIAMPSKQIKDNCPNCHKKNVIQAIWCNWCGARLAGDRAPRADGGRLKLYSDIIHPIDSCGRKVIHEAVMTAYYAELILSSQPGYRCRYDDHAAPAAEQCPPHIYAPTTTSGSNGVSNHRGSFSYPIYSSQSLDRSPDCCDSEEEFGVGI